MAPDAHHQRIQMSSTRITSHEDARVRTRARRCLRSFGFPRFLTAIAFSVATTVRGETERTSTLAEGRARLLPRDRSAGAGARVHRVGTKPPKSRQHAALFRARNGPAEFQLSHGRGHCRDHSGVFEVRHQLHHAGRAASSSGESRGGTGARAGDCVRRLWTGGRPLRRTVLSCSISSIFRAFRLSGRVMRLWKRRKNYSL